MGILKLITHSYAPELNQLVFKNGSRLRAPSCTTIKEAKSRLGFIKANSSGHRVTVKVSSELHPCLNKVYRGTVNTLADLKDFLSKLRLRHNLPDHVIKVTSLFPVSLVNQSLITK